MGNITGEGMEIRSEIKSETGQQIKPKYKPNNRFKRKIGSLLVCTVLVTVLVFSHLLDSGRPSGNGMSDGVRGSETPVYAAEHEFITPTPTPVPGATTTPTPTLAPGVTATPTPTLAPGVTATPTPTLAPGVTATPTPTPTLAPGVTATPTPIPTPTTDPNREPVMLGIFASYSGSTPVVGDKLDKSKVKVVAYYDTGNTLTLSSGVVLSNDVMSQKGTNKVVVLYKTFTTTLYVTAKELTGITASTTRPVVSVGNALDEQDFNVVAHYSDYSTEKITDFELEAPAPTEKGEQKAVITYREKQVVVSYSAKDAEKPTGLYAEYLGEEAVAGGKIDRSLLVVKAIFADATTEKITTYKLSKTPVVKGAQTMKVSYMGLEATFKVTLVDRKAVKLEAEYKGRDIAAGNMVEKKDIEVKATFNDGTTEVVTDFTMYSRVVGNVGENELRVYYEDVQASIFVTGVEEEEIDFSHHARFRVKADDCTAKVYVGLPKWLETSSVKVKTLKQSKVERLMRQVEGLETYIPFTFTFTNSDDEDELPLRVRISIPDDYDIEYTRVYYTPNRRTVLADLQTVIVEDQYDMIEFLANDTGTYILAYVIVEEVDYEEDDWEDEDDDDWDDDDWDEF